MNTSSPRVLAPRRPLALRLAAITLLLTILAAAVGESVQSRTAEASTTASLWLTPAEIAALPTSGTAWSNAKKAADATFPAADISNQDSNHDVHTLAAALVYARTGQASYGNKARDAIAAAIGTEAGGRTLALGRNLTAYVIAADVMNLRSFDPALDTRFRGWLTTVRTRTLDSRTLISTHEDRPNNWGTMAGAARIAASAYLGDRTDLARAATVFRGYLGDRQAYAGFKFGSDLTWACSTQAPVGINPKGCVKSNRNIDGAQPEEMRRGGSFQWPPARTGYAWEGLQGSVVQAELLHRQGYDAWAWSDRAVLRAVDFLYRLDGEVGGWAATGDDTWQPWLINYTNNSSYPTATAQSGKNMGFTDWTHAGRRSAPAPAPEPDPAPAPAPAPEPDPAPAPAPSTAVVIHRAIEDSIVRADQPSRNYGKLTTIRSRETSPVIRSYIKFDVRGATASSQAFLRLYVTEATAPGAVVHRVTGSWAESLLTFKNAPTPGAALGTASGLKAGQWVEINLGNAVTRDGIHSLAVSGLTTKSAFYSSREGVHAPQLHIRN